MGSIIGKAMDDNMKKNQEFMLATQQMQMERQIQMQNYMREQMMAMQLAKSREMFNWLGSFYVFYLGIAALGLARRKPAVFVPFLPLTWITAYQADMCYGDKVHRIRAQADEILCKEYSLLALPSDLPTMCVLDNRRAALQVKEE